MTSSTAQRTEFVDERVKDGGLEMGWCLQDEDVGRLGVYKMSELILNLIY